MEDEIGQKRAFLSKILRDSRGLCIETDHLLIAPFHKSDIPQYLAIEERDSLLPGPHFHQRLGEEFLGRLAKFLDQPQHSLTEQSYPFRPYSAYHVDPDTQRPQLIGFLLLSPLISPSMTGRAGVRTAGNSPIAYIIDAPFRGRGFGKEMLHAVTHKLIPPFLKKHYIPASNEIDEMPMPFLHLSAYIDLNNISSINTAYYSGFIPHDLTVDTQQSDGEGYQIQFHFPASEQSPLSEQDHTLIRSLPDPNAQDKLIQRCKERTKQREDQECIIS
jgi:RimJ/RimL family protein N-acetyltransferase